MIIIGETYYFSTQGAGGFRLSFPVPPEDDVPGFGLSFDNNLSDFKNACILF